MLTPEEIKQIGAEMAQVIEDNVNPQFEGVKKQIGLEMCQVIEDNMNPQFESINKQFEGVNKQFESVNERLETMSANIQDIRADIQDIRNTMVTKEYLDKKLAQDMQLRSLVDLLEVKKVISADEAKRLFIMDPFPQTL